mmetsp:Transcript_84611/g.273476  ORF Transcript_84611/g.273476 Transcript_84611/m.273476 type:complete len:103 (+) Transcript_84611:661-969(+)
MFVFASNRSLVKMCLPNALWLRVVFMVWHRGIRSVLSLSRFWAISQVKLVLAASPARSSDRKQRTTIPRLRQHAVLCWASPCSLDLVVQLHRISQCIPENGQ